MGLINKLLRAAPRLQSRLPLPPPAMLCAIQFRVWTLKAWVYHNEVNDMIMCIRFAMTLFGGPLGKKLIGLARKAKGFSSGGL